MKLMMQNPVLAVDIQMNLDVLTLFRRHVVVRHFTQCKIYWNGLGGLIKFPAVKPYQALVDKCERNSGTSLQSIQIHRYLHELCIT